MSLRCCLTLLTFASASPAVAYQPETLWVHLVADSAGNGNPCLGEAGLVACPEALVHGRLNQPYHAYLLMVGADTTAGVSGVGFGIRYGEGLEIDGWSSCVSGLEIPSQPAYTPWPMSCSGLIVTWLLPGDCQRTVLPGQESFGIVAVIGALHVQAVSTARLELGLNPNGIFQWTDCTGRTRPLETCVGWAGFGNEYGTCNWDSFCHGNIPYCAQVPTLPTTWGRMKSFYSRSP